MPVGKRGYVAGNFGIELEGMQAGWLESFEGGMAITELVYEKLGPDHIQHKHISGVKYEDITVVLGTGMSDDIWDWISDSFNKRDYTRKNGAIIAANFNFKETSRLSFYNAIITEVTFPACDATATTGARVTCKITPEYTRVTTSTDGGPPIKGTMDRGKQMKWSPANFRLKIDGCDTSRVWKIDPITLRQKTQLYQIGEMRDYQVEPVQIEYPNLVITVPESHSKDLWDWHQSFVVDGKCTEDQEKGGTLEYLSPNLEETLLTLTFTRLGMFKVTPDKAEAGSEGIRRVKFEMYCEKIDFDYDADAIWD